MEEKSFRLGKQIIHEDDLKIKVEYNGEIFTLRYPNPIQKAAIEAEIARRLNGLSREAYPVDHVAMLEAHCFVENLYIPKECPDWFQGAWVCYDEMLIAELYAGYLRFRDNFRERIKQGKFSPTG